MLGRSCDNEDAGLGWLLSDKEALKIRERKRRLRERAVLLQDPRNTTIAVDKQALEKQLTEKKQLQALEKRRDAAFEQQLQLADQAAHQRAQLREEELQARRSELLQSWAQQQRAVQQRRCRERAAAAAEEPYHLRFAGEDEVAAARRRQQQEEQQRWLRAQLHERQRGKERLEAQHREAAAVEAALQARADELQRVEDLCRRAQQLSCAEVNAALVLCLESCDMAREAANREAEERRLAREAEQRHVECAVSGSLLTEDPAAARSRLAPDRMLCDRWKGFSPAQREQQRQELEEQLKSNQERQERLRREQAEWERQAAVVDQKSQKDLQRAMEEKRRLQAELVAANARLSSQQRQRRREEHELYGTNQPTDDYFDGFGVYAR